MSKPLVVGKLQERLVQRFTHIEVVTLTAWLYLALLGVNFGIRFLETWDLAYLLVAIFWTGLSILILELGLHREHDIATESGNAGPDAQ